MTKLELQKLIKSNIKTRDGVPKGAFCRADLEAQGMSQTQASALLKDLRLSGSIVFIGKFKTKKYTGDMNWTPFYEVVK